MLRMLVVGSTLLAVSTILCSPSQAQGITDYLNFESPQVKALAVATLNDVDYLLACNTPDNSVELYRVSDLSFIVRVAVGQEPVSVTWDSEGANSGHFYTCNFIGDSVSRVAVEWTGSQIEARLDRTSSVGDEPMHAVVHADTIYVSLNTTSSYAFGPKNLLTPLATRELVQSLSGSEYALAQPRAMAIANDRLYVLAFRGHPTSYPNLFPPQPPSPPSCIGSGYSSTLGFDIHIEDLQTGNSSRIGNLGTIGFNMVADGGNIFVVSGDAQTHLTSEAEVRDANFGFVRSLLHRIPVTLPFAVTRDLNQTDTGAKATPAEAICQPTDVVVYRNTAGMARVFVTSFGTDRIAYLDGVAGSTPLAPNDWTLGIVDLGPPPARRKGPRCLAMSYGDPSSDLDDRVFALNRLTNSVTVLNPSNLQFSEFALQHDPVPPHIRDGQSFLYDGLLSGSGMVSCASCHIDGRLDARSWHLGGGTSTSTDLAGPSLSALLDIDPDLQPSFADPALRAQVGSAGMMIPAAGWTTQKGAMATQSLQGLLNWEVESRQQRYVTNAPYHWRGDRVDFRAFRGAFVSLMGAAEAPSEPGLPIRPSATEMLAFETFVNSLAYPPNPEQPQSRQYSGSFGDPRQLAGGADPGTDAQLGLKAFHTGSGDGDLNCSSCHSLPEGSNNRIAISAPAPPTSTPCLFKAVVNENPSLRGLRQKENKLIRFDPLTGEHSDPGIRLGPEFGGFIHSGSRGYQTATFDDHIFGFFSVGLGANTYPVIEFVRQLDTGTAPLVGDTWTCDLGNKPQTRLELLLYRQQAFVGNVGIAVQAWLTTPTGPVYRGFRYFPDVSGATKDEFVEELKAGPGPTISLASLLALVDDSDDRLVFHATPLGSDRRVAHPLGQPPIEEARRQPPRRLAVLPMEPNTAHWRVPLLVDRWDIQPPAGIQAIPPRGTADTVIGSFRSLAAQRVMQRALVSAGQVDHLRHEPPRRFLVAGANIRSGARLRITVSHNPLQEVVLPLYPTGRRTSPGVRVWTTAVELEPQEYMGFMVGGDSEPDLAHLLDGTLLESVYGAESPIDAENLAALHFEPAIANHHRFTVINADGSSSWVDSRLLLSDPSAQIPGF